MKSSRIPNEVFIPMTVACLLNWAGFCELFEGSSIVVVANHTVICKILT